MTLGSFQSSLEKGFVESPCHARNYPPIGPPTGCIACCPGDGTIVNFPPEFLVYPNLCCTIQAPRYPGLDGISFTMQGSGGPPGIINPFAVSGFSGSFYTNLSDTCTAIEPNGPYCHGLPGVASLVRCCLNNPPPPDTGNGEFWQFYMSVTDPYNFYNTASISATVNIRMFCGPIRGVSDSFILLGGPQPDYNILQEEINYCYLGFPGPYVPGGVGPVTVSLRSLPGYLSSDRCQNGTGFCYTGVSTLNNYFGLLQLYQTTGNCSGLYPAYGHLQALCNSSLMGMLAPPQYRQANPCKFLGKDTGKRIECASCRKPGTQLKVFECALYKECTIPLGVPETQACQFCPKYEAKSL